MYLYLIPNLFMWLIIIQCIFSSTEKKIVEWNESMKICFPEIDECFSIGPPWNGFWRFLPQSPKDINIQFFVITRNTQHKSIADWKVTTSDTYEPLFENLQAVDYQEERYITAIHFYGLFSNEDKKWRRLSKMARAYLFGQDANAIVVDWDSNSHKHDYRQCVSNTRIVAAVVVKFIKSLMQNFNLTPDRIHLIGFSLGAHIAGYIGKSIPNIYRITALDAAQPGFEGMDDIVHVHQTDANFVDALHTDAEHFIPKLGFGYRRRIGDVDFYFNGGKDQPGCWSEYSNENEISGPNDIYTLLKNPHKVAEIISHGIRCSHERAVKYWIEALRNNECTMIGKKLKPSFHRLIMKDYCTRVRVTDSEHPIYYDDYLDVGLDTFTRPLRGIFHVQTNSHKPYCMKLGLEP